MPKYEMPGVHLGVSEEDYHSLPYVSSSRLNRLHGSSMLHVMHDMKAPRAATPSMSLGSAIHSAVLEPHLLGEKFCRSEYEDFRSKEAKIWKEEVQSRGLRVLSAEQWEVVAAASDAVSGHKSAGKVLASRTATEQTVVWDDVATGLRCKARIDGMAELNGIPLLVDLKSTISAASESFAKSIYNFGYHRQLAFYRLAAQQSGNPVSACVIIAVENTLPCAVQVFRVLDTALDRGEVEVRALLQQWLEGYRYADSITEIGIPEWALKQGDRS